MADRLSVGRSLAYSPVSSTRNINQVRSLRGVARAGRGGVSEFLKKAVTPPSDTALRNALELLLHIGE